MSDPRRDQTLRLRDGRTLGFAEFGPADGRPLFLFHGTPGNRLTVEAFWPDEPGDWRVIAPDRPGLGLSTAQKNRHLLGWPDDVRQLADHLGIDRFWVAGVSGGGCHALACAYALTERVNAVASICGGAPITEEAIRAMHGPNRAAFKAARSAPFLLNLSFGLNRLLYRRVPRLVERTVAAGGSMPPSDREVLQNDHRFKRIMFAATIEDLNKGVDGVVADTRIHALPWGFDPAAIRVPVLQFHGEEDRNAPVAMARQLHAVIPGSVLEVYPGEGHLIVPRHWADISAALASANGVSGQPGASR